MAKTINIPRRNTGAQVNSFQLPKQAERVQDDSQHPVLPLGQVVKAPLPQRDGIKGTLPLGSGALLRGVKPTPGERAVLEQYEWKDGDDLPANIAELLNITQQIRREATTNIPPPVPLTTPPLVLPPEQPFEALPQAHQEEILKALREAKAVGAKEDAAAQQQRQGAPQGVNEAIAAAYGMGNQVDLVDDRADPTYMGTQVPKRDPDREAPAEGPPQAQLAACPHCGWDLGQPCPPEPDDTDKFVFVQSILGGLPFQKHYSLLNDQLSLTLRSLTVQEIDLCHKQAFLDRDAGELVTSFDITEQIIRYRMSLQVVSLHGTAASVDLPDTSAGWKESLVEAGRIPEGKNTFIRSIKEYFDETVIKSESIFRLISGTAGQFNRMLSKLEANYQNPDFWKGTAV